MITTPPQTEPLEPRIARFVESARDEMSASHVAEILDISPRTMTRLIEQNKIGNRKDYGRSQRKPKYTITKAAVIIYIVRSTEGDHGTVLDAIRESCPRWLPVAQKAAAGVPETSGKPTAVQCLKRRLSASHDPYAAHPDFFRTSGE